MFRRILAVALLLCLVFQPLISQADELGKHILNSILAKKKPSDASLLLLSRDLGWYFDNMEFLPAEYRDRIQDLRVEVAGRSAQDAAAKLGEPEAIFGATGSWKPGRDMDLVYFGKNIRKARLQVNASFEEITANILSRHGPSDEILRSAAGIAIPGRLSTGTMSLVVSDVPDFGYKDLERAYLGAKEAFERGESREMVMKRLRDHFWEGLGKNYEAHMASTAPDMYRGAGGQEWWSANYLENPQKMQTFVRDPGTGKWSLKEGGLKAVPEEILERVGFGAFKGRGGAKFSKIASDYAMFFKHEEGGLSATAKYVYRIWDDVDGQVIAKAVAREDVRFFLVANRIAQDPQNAAKYLADFNMTEGPLKKGLSDMLYRWTEKQLIVDTEKLVNELASHLLSAPASNLDDLIADLVAKARLKFDLHDMASGLDILRQAPNDAQKKLIKALEARFGESEAGKLTIKYIKKQLRLLADEGGELTLRILKMLKDMGRIQDDPYQRAVKSFEETGKLTDDLADTVIMARKEVMLISSAGMFDVVDDPQALDRLMEMWRKIHSGAIIQSPNRELAAFRTEFRNLLDSELRRLGWTVDELRIPVGIKQKLLGGPALLMKLEGKLGGKLAKSGVTIRQFQSKIHEILFNPAYTRVGDQSASVGPLDAFIGVATGLYMTYDILFNQNLSPEEENLQLGNAWVTALPIVGDFAQGLITGSQGWYEGDYEKVLEAGLWISIGVMGCVPGGQLPAVILGISLATKPLVVSAYNAGQAQNLVRAWVESGDWAMEEKPHKLKGLFDRGEKLHAITYEDLLTEKGNQPYKSKMADSPSAAAVVADGLLGIDVTMNGSIRAYAEQYVIPQFTAIRSMRAGLKNLYPDFNDQDWTDELTAKKKIVDRGGKGGLPLFGAYYRLRTKALEQTLAQLKSWAEDEKRAEKDYDAEVARLKGELQKLQDELKCPTLISHADESVEAYSRVIKNVWEQESLSLSKLRIYEHYLKTYKTIAGKLRRVSDLFRECSVPYVPPSWHLMGFPEFDVDRVNTLLSSMENGRKGVIENIEKLLKEFDQPVTKYDPANECHKKAFDVLAPLRYKVAFNENLILYYKQLADSDSTWSSAYDAAKQRYTQQRDSLMKQAGKSARDLVESAAFLDAFMTYVASIPYGLASKDAELYRSTSRDYEVRLSGAQMDHKMNGLAGEALRGCLLAALRLELVLSETEPEEGQDIKASVRLTGGTPPKENHWDWKTSGGLRASSRAGQEITVNASSEGVVTVRLLDDINREVAKVLATASAPVKPKKKDGKKDEQKPEDKKPEDKKPEDKKIGLVPPVIQTCSYQYSEWGECSRETKKQTRTVTGREPQGCVEKVKPILEQACTPPTAAIKITVPAEVMETDLFKASAQVSPDIAGRASKYIWGGGAELINPDEKGTRSTKTPQATLQFQPMTGKRGEPFDPNQKIYLDVYDGAGKLMGKGEIPIKLKPVGFSASAAWEVTPVADGFNLKRKEAIKKAPCGDQSCEAVVRGTLQLRWTGGSLGSNSSAPKNMEDLKKEVPRLHVGKMQGTYHAVTPGKDEEFAIGDFKGLVAHKPPQLYYQGSEYVDLVFPGTQSWVTGYLLKGNSRIFINGDVSGGGSRKGEGGQYWFDDTPFVDQHTKAAHAEMMAILKSIVIGPDNKIKQIPYKGPAFDGSNLPSVKLVYSQKGKLKIGEVVLVKAVVEKAKPEDSPLKFEWSGDHEGQGETVHFMAQKAGKSTLSVTVTGARFPMGSASANFEVEDLKAVIIKDAPPANSFPVGTKARFSAALTSGGQKVSGNYFYRWQTNTEVTFEPPEGAASQTTGVFRRIGRTRVWVEVLVKKGASLSTVARSENLELDIINPKLSLSAVPDTPLVGQEVKITVQEDPKIEEKTIDFWWEIAGNAANPGPLQNNRFYTYKPKDTKPVTVTVHAKGRDKGDDFGSQKIAVTAKAYTVSVSSPKYLGTKPRIWKCDTEFGRECPGLVEVGDTQFAVHHDLFMKASINPSVDSSKLRYGWTISPDGCSGGGSISEEIRLNCSNAGTYVVKVEVTNTDGAKLGEAAQSVAVSISQETLNNSKKAKEAYDKLHKAKELVAQGKLDEGLALANESASLDPKNAEAKSLSQKWRTEKQTVTQQLEKTKKLITENQIDQAEKELAVAQKLHPKYAPVVEMERLLKDKSKEVNEKTGKAKQLRAEGEALQRQGKLKEAVVLYKESLNYLLDKGLEEHLRKLEAQIAQDAQKKNTADRLWQEGTGLYGQKKLSEALAKFKESLALWQDPTKAEYVRKLEAERTAAQKLREEGAALQQQGRLADAVKKYKESLTHWPSPDLESHISVVEGALKRKQDADFKKGTADTLWQEGTGFFNQGRPSDALTKFKESLGYWSDATRTKYVSDLEARRVKAVTLRDEGAKLQQQNRIQEAIAKYKDSQTFWPDPGLTSHIATLEGKLKEDTDTAARKARAKQLRDEGYALQQRSQIREAIAKYTESLTDWPDADLENHIRQLKTKLAQDPVKPPLPTTTSRFGAILGHTLNVREVANVIYNGTWTRRDGTDLFDAVWDPHARDVIEIESVNGNQIVLYRHGNKGRYSGTLSADGSRIISGTASWYPAGWSWSATVSGRSTEGQRDPSPPPAVPSKKPGFSLDPFVGKWNMTSPDGTKVVLKTWIKDGRIMGAAEANGQNLRLDLYPIGDRQLKGTIKISFALTSGGKKVSEMTTNGSVLAALSPDGKKMPLKIISEKGESTTIMLERLSGTVETGPSLAGAWTCNGRPTSITQDASGNLVFTNEMGWVSKGRFAGAGTVIATNWENGLAGSLQDNNNTIRWANGTTWYRKR